MGIQPGTQGPADQEFVPHVPFFVVAGSLIRGNHFASLADVSDYHAAVLACFNNISDVHVYAVCRSSNLLLKA